MTVRISYEVAIQDDVDTVRSPTINLEYSEGSHPFERLKEELTDLVAILSWLVNNRIIKSYEIAVSIEEGEE